MSVETSGNTDVSIVDAMTSELRSEIDNEVVASMVVICCNDERDIDKVAVVLDILLVVVAVVSVEV